MIDLKQLKRLIKLMVDNDLTELDLQDGDEKVALKRGGGDQPIIHTGPMVGASHPGMLMGADAQAGAAAGAGGEPGSATTTDADAGLVTVPCPMVGTYYTASSPDAEPFARVGQSIGPDTTIGLIEAMKVFSEIKAEVAGTVERILVENGQAVDNDTDLMLVRPA